MADSPQFLSPKASGSDTQSVRRIRKRQGSGRRSLGASEPPDLATDEQVAEESTLPLLVEPRGGIPPIIDTASALDKAATKLLSSVEPVAVDTERAQGRTYGSAAYLVQIRRSDIGTFLIDAHALPDLSILSQSLNTEWILHAADQDLACMEDLGLAPSSIFDTEVAARLLGAEHFGLGALTEEYLGIRLKKNHQNEDWSTRPLPKDWLAYAALDVELLPQLREVLYSKLQESGRIEWAEQEFSYELSNPIRPRPNHWRNLKGIGKLKRSADLAVAKELWLEREEIARRTDTAPGRVLTGNAIIEAALTHPESRKEILKIADFRRPLARRNAEKWWQAVSRAYEMPRDQLPPRPVSDPFSVPAAGQWKRIDSSAAERLSEVREVVGAIAEPLDIAPDVVLSAKVQRSLAWWPINHEVPTAENPQPRRVSIRSKSAFVDAVIDRISYSDARPWQQELVRSYLEATRNPLPKIRAAEPRPTRTQS